jgi:exosortase
VVGPALIGRNAVVEAHSVIVRTAVWADAHVGPRCEIRESIVGCGARVPAGTALAAETALVGSLDRSLSHRLFWSQRRDEEAEGQRAPSRVGRWAAWLSQRRRPIAQGAAGAAILAAFLWSYWPTLVDLMGVWRRSDEYSSGLLVPFLAAYVVWLRRQELRSTVVRPALVFGVGVFLFAQAVRGAGLFDLYSFVERFSIILSLAAVVLLVAGWRHLAKLAPVLLLLCLMLPWPGRMQNAITLPLQSWSTTAAVFCLELAGYEIRQDGNVIHIGTASVAVAEACNGLRMIMAFFVISGLVVLLVKRAWWEKLIVLLSSFPIAFFCNTLRLAATAVAFTVIRGEQWEQRFHDWGGYAMMPLALALVVGELWFLARLTTPPVAPPPLVICRRPPQHASDP